MVYMHETTKKITVWRENGEKIAEEMEEYARNYRCNKCNRFYCNHMLRVRAAKFRRKIDKSMSELIQLAISSREIKRGVYSA